MNKKKIIIIVVSVVVVAAVIGGSIGGYRWHQSQNLVAEVVSVADMNMGYGEEEMSSYGMVTNDTSQDVYYMEEQSIKEVYVEEGQTVSVGDKLLSYDMTMADLQLEMKELDITDYTNKLESAKRELERLKATTPIPEMPEEPEQPEPPEEPDQPEEPQIPEKTGHAYNYISLNAKPNKGKGTEDEPYIFLCTKDCYVLGEYLNSLSADEKKPVYAVFEIHKGNKLSGKLISSWKVSGASGMPKVEEDSKWAVRTRTPVAEDIPEEPTEEPIPDEPVTDEPEGYTAKELKDLIREKEAEIRDLDLNKRKAELELEQMKRTSASGEVLATINGVVKSVGDKDNPPTDGSAFLTISGSEGLYVKGFISELMLDKIEVGTTVYANSWESGMSFEAEITEISTYPQENNQFWGEGNPNVSYYPYTAYIANPEGLQNGEEVALSMTGKSDSAGGIYLEKAYVREEDGKSYVLKVNKKNRLEKQYVVTGKTLWGQAVEIVSGLTLEDRIAFPYGKTAKEGLKVEESSDGIMY